MNVTHDLGRLLTRYSDEVQTAVADTARAERANPSGFPTHVAVYFGPVRREDGTACSSSTRTRKEWTR